MFNSYLLVYYSISFPLNLSSVVSISCFIAFSLLNLSTFLPFLTHSFFIVAQSKSGFCLSVSLYRTVHFRRQWGLLSPPSRCCGFEPRGLFSDNTVRYYCPFSVKGQVHLNLQWSFCSLRIYCCAIYVTNTVAPT